MSAVLDLGLAGVHIRIESQDAEYLGEAEKVFGEFKPAHGSEPNLTLRVRRTAPQPLLHRDIYPVTSELRLGRLHIERADHFKGWLELSRGYGEVTVQARGMRDLPRSWTSGLNSMLRVCTSLLVQRRGGVMIHASAVALKGRGFVFTGVSGAGKTTIATLAPEGATVVGDDLVLVVPEPGTGRGQHRAWQVFGTPFLGEWRGRPDAGPYPLAGLFHLVQAEQNALGTRPLREARRALLRNLVNFDPSSKVALDLLDLANALTTHYRGAELEFNLDGGVWSLLEGYQRDAAAAGAPA